MWRVAAAAALAGSALTLAARAAVRRRPLARALSRRMAVADPPARVGDALADVDTPALLVDLDAFEANVRLLDESLDGVPETVRVRPHIKSHKCSELARIQLRGRRCDGGVCAAKVGEAEAMVRGGVPDVHLANEVVGERKLERLARVAAEAEAAGGRVSVCVDSDEALRDLSRHAAAAGCTVGVLVEINTGQNRCGVGSPEEALALALAADALPGVAFRGIQGYQGAAQHVREPEGRAAAAARVASLVRAAREACEAAGLEVAVTTGGGTGTYAADAAAGELNELQPGSYCFSDADYERNTRGDGEPAWHNSLTVLSAVMSASPRNDWVVLDAGLKAHSLDSGLPHVLGSPGAVCENGGDEHLVVRGLDGACPGARVRLVPGHCDPTVNMHDWVVAHRGDRVVGVYRVEGRGPGV